MEKEKPKPKPILIDGLTLPQKVKLAQTRHSPGWEIVEMLMESACEDSRIAVNDVDPEDEEYERILKARQQWSRDINKFSVLLLRSIEYHIANGASEEMAAELEVLKTMQHNPSREAAQ